jgi:flagellar export protein FliJ
MAFRFSLGAVLKYREGIEQREFLLLEKLQNEVALAEQRIRQIDQAFSAAEQARAKELADGVCGADLKSAYEYRAALEQQRQLHLTQLKEARFKWQRQLRSYQEARRSRETLASLRDKQMEAYVREQHKREQNTLDDIFLSRRKRQS